MIPFFVASPLMAKEADVPKPDESAMMEWLQGEYMLGDWNGLRTDLAKRGIDLEFFYFGSMPSNVSGGIKTGTAYQGGLLSTLGLRSEELFGYHGGNFFLSTAWLNGEEDFSNRHIGDLNKVNLTDFGNMYRLWEMWYSQKFLADKLLIKTGVLSVDRDFIAPEYYNSIASINFINQTFFFPTLAFNLYDIPGFPTGNHSLPSTPYGALGLFARYNTSDSTYIQAAVYDGNPDDSGRGTDFRLAADEGALFYAETGFRWNTKPEQSGLPGSVKLGGFYHTDEFYDVKEGTVYAVANAFGVLSVTPGDHSGNYGGYLLAEQYLWLEQGKSDPAMQGGIAFFRLAGAPKDRNLTQFGIDGGFVFKGLVPSRDWDTVSLGMSYLQISDDIGDAVDATNATYGTAFKRPDYEGLIELSYKAQMTTWWTIQPSAQWVLHPGGLTNLANPPDNAFALILQSTLRF
ncbi:MAG: carbohydrate porin [Luteolibacter sp.]